MYQYGVQLLLAAASLLALCTAQTCPSGIPNAGVCVNGACGGGLQCVNNQYCCPTVITPGGNCVGPCTNGLCPVGYTCNTASQQCCSGTVTPAPSTCPAGTTYGGVCPGGVGCVAGYQCYYNSVCCRQTIVQQGTCANGQLSTTLCVNGQCTAGLICYRSSNGVQVCCPQTTTGVGTCRNGQPAASGCWQNNWCGRGYYCENAGSPNARCCRPGYGKR